MIRPLSRRDFIITAAANVITGCRSRKSVLQFGQLDAIDGAISQLAASLGYFRKEKVDVIVTLDPSGAVIVQQMSSMTGALDLGVMGLPPLCTMITQNHTHPVVIATVSGSASTCQLVTFSATGITSGPATLKHRAVGFTPGTVSQMYLSRLLAKSGLKMVDVKGFAGAQSSLIDSLIQGDIDAAVLWDPNAQLAVGEYIQRLRKGASVKDRGTPAVYSDPSVLYVATQIVARMDSIQRKRDELIRFLRALIDADQFLASNRAAAQKSIAQWVNLPTSDLDHFFSTSNFHVRLELGTLEQSIRDTTAWLKEQNPQSTVPSKFSSYIDASLLREIDSTRVTNA